MRLPNESEIRMAMEEGYSRSEASKGYVFAEYFGIPNTEHVERIDVMSVFDGDVEAGEYAKSRGENVVRIESLPYPFCDVYFRNNLKTRSAIKEYIRNNFISIFA